MIATPPDTLSRIEVCRVCRSAKPIPVLDLGMHPLANALQKPGEGQAVRYPLNLAFCSDCGTVQLLETVNKEQLFRHYVWVTGTGQATHDYAGKFCQRSSEVAGLKAGDFVVEIASNDGTFLRHFQSRGNRVLGVDPAQNLATLAQSRGIPTEAEFWDERLAGNIVSRFGPARFVFGRNVIAHVSELHSVVRGISQVMADDGVGAFEFHSAASIFDGLQYDSIYHEHLCYFSLLSIEVLLKSFGLLPFHVEHSPISGGALVVYFARQRRAKTDVYQRQDEKERESRLDCLSTWQEFSRRCYQHRELTLKLLRTLGDSALIGFGASARSSTFLNFCSIRYPQLRCIIDNNSLKHQCVSPGTGIPILSLNDGLALRPDYIFILAWNFGAEIRQHCIQSGFRGSFLVAFPGDPKTFSFSGPPC